MIFPESGIPCCAGALVIRGFVHKNHAMFDEPLESRRAIIGKRPNNFLIVVAVIREPVGFNHRPIGKVREKKVR